MYYGERIIDMGGPTESVSDFTLGCTWSKSSSICHNYKIICGYMVWLYLQVSAHKPFFFCGARTTRSHLEKPKIHQGAHHDSPTRKLRGVMGMA